MGRCHSRLVATLLISLFAIPCWALTGPQTAQQLNQRLAATPAQCIGGKPPLACSGVLLLPMPEDHPQPFWHHGSEAEARGSERFHFLRRDSDPRPLPGKVGYILQDLFSATGQGKPYEVLADDGTAPGDVMVRNWPVEAPDKVAIQALYYDSADPDALFRAQRGQFDWFEATGTWLPLVRLATDNGAGEFGFSQQEQLYNGYQIADRLNARYARTATTCTDGRAAYYCNGVIGRTTDVGNFHAWNPSPNSVKGNGVSFMYFRADTDTGLYKPQGFVVRELAYPAGHPLTLRCIYPYDGYTGAPSDHCDFRPSCASLNINSVASWKARYLSTPYQSCYFGTSSAEFQLALDIRRTSGAVDTLHAWSEVIMAAWPQDIGKLLTLEAFFHGTPMPPAGGDGLSGAKRFQQDYYQTDRRYLPVLEIRRSPADGKAFVFHPEQQHFE